MPAAQREHALPLPAVNSDKQQQVQDFYLRAILLVPNPCGYFPLKSSSPKIPDRHIHTRYRPFATSLRARFL